MTGACGQWKASRVLCPMNRAAEPESRKVSVTLTRQALFSHLKLKTRTAQALALLGSLPTHVPACTAVTSEGCRVSEPHGARTARVC